MTTSNSEPLNVEMSHVAASRLILENYRDDLSLIARRYGALPLPGSIGHLEEQACSDGDALRTTFAQGALLVEIAGDQITALIKTLTDPVEAFAPWVCGRAALEACALGIWLLDPEISATERLTRGLTLRYEGLEQQRKFLVAAGGDVEHAMQRLDSVVQDAVRLGIKPVRDKKRRIVGIGRAMPSATALIRDEMGAEASYRLQSAVAHGHHWAVTQLGFRVLPDDPKRGDPPGLRAMTKAPMPAGLVSLCRDTLEATMRLVAAKGVYCGWDRDELSRIALRAMNEFSGVVDSARPLSDRDAIT